MHEGLTMVSAVQVVYMINSEAQTPYAAKVGSSALFSSGCPTGAGQLGLNRGSCSPAPTES